MKGPGILWMLQTAAGMSMAGPIFFLGLESLRLGRYTWAVGYLTLGALVLYFPTYLVNRIGGPRTWIRRRLSRGSDAESDPGPESESASTPDSDAASDGSVVDADGDGDGDADAGTGDGRATVLDRFRR